MDKLEDLATQYAKLHVERQNLEHKQEIELRDEHSTQIENQLRKIETELDSLEVSMSTLGLPESIVDEYMDLALDLADQEYTYNRAIASPYQDILY